MTPPFYHYYYASSGGLAVEPVDVSTYFSNSNPSCPIIKYYIQRETSPGVFSTFSSGETYIDASNKHSTVTITGGLITAPMDRTDLYVVAETKAGKLARYNFRVKVCGNEVLSPVGGLQTKFVYQKGNGVQQIPADVYETVSDSLCPIQSYSLHVSTDGGLTYTPWLNDLNVLSFSPNNVLVNTATSQSNTIYIKT